MSDSDEDFASADEGEVDSTPAADSPKALGAVKEVATKSKAEKKDDSKPQADSAKSQNQDNIPAGKKKGKGKNEKKSEENKAPEASGGTVNAPVKEPDVKPKGKKGKNKDRGKKNANKVAEPKENKTESDKSGVVSNTQEDKIAAVKDEPVDISEAQDGTNACSDNVKVDNAATDKKGNDNEGDNGKAKSLDIDNESVKDNVDEASESKNDTDSNDASGDNKDISIDNVPASPSGKLSVEQKADLIKSPSSQSISRPQPDHTDKQEEVLDKLASSAKEKSSGGWGWGWGSSLLDVASSSVSTFTNQVGEGFNTVLETVESTLNMPNPEELAKQNTAIDNQDDDNDVSKPEKDDTKPVPKEEDKSTSLSKDGEPDKTVEDKTQTSNQSTADGESSGSSSGWFSSWGVSNITKMVESTSKNLVTGSLDVLETLGKKTFDVINEHDPGLRKARAFLHDRGDKPNLSAILRDAKDQEEVRVQHEKESEEARKAHFGSLFDDYQGLAHLEALEMLSNQCEKRVNVILNNLPAETITSIKPQLLLIKQNFEIDDDDDDDDDDVTQDFDKLVTDILHNLNVGTTPDKLIKTKQSIEDNFKQCNESADSSKIKEIHRVAISSLAEFTSKSIEQFHKAGELILIQKTREYNYVDCSNLLRSFTKILTTETGILSTNFTECLNKMEGDDEIKVNHLVTNIFLEASNSSSYIQDGFRLLLPVIQQAAIESSQEPE